jgi:hypothetical protein
MAIKGTTTFSRQNRIDTEYVVIFGGCGSERSSIGAGRDQGQSTLSGAARGGHLEVERLLSRRLEVLDTNRVHTRGQSDLARSFSRGVDAVVLDDHSLSNADTTAVVTGEEEAMAACPRYVEIAVEDHNDGLVDTSEVKDVITTHRADRVGLPQALKVGKPVDQSPPGPSFKRHDVGDVGSPGEPANEGSDQVMTLVIAQWNSRHAA